jgi:hypothetical protein
MFLSSQTLRNPLAGYPHSKLFMITKLRRRRQSVDMLLDNFGQRNPFESWFSWSIHP